MSDTIPRPPPSPTSSSHPNTPSPGAFNLRRSQTVLALIPDATARLVSCLRQKAIEAIHGAAATVQDWTPVTDGDFVLPYANSQTFAGAVMTGETRS